jgi:hypothetical protein
MSEWQMTSPQPTGTRWRVVRILRVAASGELFDTVDKAGEAMDMMRLLNPGATFAIAVESMPLDEAPT